MIEKPQSERKTENRNNGDDRPFGYLYGVVIAGVWAFIVVLFVSLFWPNLTERTKFFTGNFFNILIAFTVIAQVVINRKQWEAMQDQIEAVKRQEKITRGALRQAEQQTAIAEDALVIQSQSYVGVH